MLSTVKTLKNDEFFRVFAIFLAKTGDFYYGTVKFIAVVLRQMSRR